MKALLDEHLSPLIARVLRERGLDVVAVAERSDLIETSDREVPRPRQTSNARW